jgi:hypothetical protein
MIDGLHIVNWFRQKYREVQKAMGIKQPKQEKEQGFKL